MSVHIWWNRNGRMALVLLSVVGSYLGLYRFIAALQPNGWSNWSLVWGIAFVGLFLAIVVLETRRSRTRTIYKKEDKAAIREYLRRWIDRSGRVAIWSRDLTWAVVPEVKNLLLEKAKIGDLVLCMPKEIPLAAELAKAGAEVCIYGAGDYSPECRFTIADFERQGARVTVGYPQGNFHVIDEFDATTHPAFYLARDLVALTRAWRTAQASRP